MGLGRTVDALVVGGGIGGLSAALALRAAGHRVRVFERSESFAEVGAGISLWPNGVMALRQLGVGGAVDRISGSMERMAYRRSDGRLLTRFSLEPLYRDVGERAAPVPRASLHEALADALGAEAIQMGTNCTGVRNTATGAAATLVKSGRSFEVEADLVVAADGTHSRLRQALAANGSRRSYVGYVNWNCLVHEGKIGSLFEADTWTTYVGEGKRASAMPAGNGKWYVFFDVPLDESEAGRSSSHVVPADDPGPGPGSTLAGELDRHFGGWAPAVGELVDATRNQRVNRIPIHDHHPPLPSFVHGRLVLLGDSAHAMAPDLGQGGCQAIEDSVVLARCLQSEPGIDGALSAYDSLRVPRTTAICLRARKRARLVHGADSRQTEAWYDDLAHEDGFDIMAGIKKSVFGGAFT